MQQSDGLTLLNLSDGSQVLDRGHWYGFAYTTSDGLTFNPPYIPASGSTKNVPAPSPSLRDKIRKMTIYSMKGMGS